MRKICLNIDTYRKFHTPCNDLEKRNVKWGCAPGKLAQGISGKLHAIRLLTAKVSDSEETSIFNELKWSWLFMPSSLWDSFIDRILRFESVSWGSLVWPWESMCGSVIVTSINAPWFTLREITCGKLGNYKIVRRIEFENSFPIHLSRVHKNFRWHLANTIPLAHLNVSHTLHIHD